MMQKQVLKICTLLSISFFFLSVSCSKSINQKQSKIVIKTEKIKKEKTVARKLLEKKNIIRRGDTIINLLRQNGADYQTAYQLFLDVKPVFDLRRLKAGNRFSCFLDRKILRGLKYQIDENRFLHVIRKNGNDKFSGRVERIPYQIKKAVINGTIESSLFNAILHAGEKAELADLMASLYEYDVDFNRDLRKGDRFYMLVEKRFLKGKFKGYNRIIAADFIQKEQSIKVILFEYPDGQQAYYHPDGSAVKKLFLKSPLPFMRVTSRYGMRRHPVMGYSAKHNGVDLGAPRGTKVKVTASGVVVRAGYHKINGRFIEVRHPNRYVTQYLHLSGIRRGIRRGSRVVQGQIIGYVGSTGRSTGPHLHYGVKKGRRYINPLRLKSPKKFPVKKAFLAQFKDYAKNTFFLLDGNNYKIDIPQKISERLKPILNPFKVVVGL